MCTRFLGLGLILALIPACSGPEAASGDVPQRPAELESQDLANAPRREKPADDATEEDTTPRSSNGTSEDRFLAAHLSADSEHVPTDNSSNNDGQGRASPPKSPTGVPSQAKSVADQEPPSNEAQQEPRSGSEKVSSASSHLNEARTYSNDEIKTFVDTVLALNDRVRTLEREIVSLRTQNEELEKQLTSQILTLRPVVTTHGTLVVHNRTNSDQHLWVNGTLRLIPATETAEIRVPTGKVTTKQLKFHS